MTSSSGGETVCGCTAQIKSGMMHNRIHCSHLCWSQNCAAFTMDTFILKRLITFFSSNRHGTVEGMGNAKPQFNTTPNKKYKYKQFNIHHLFKWCQDSEH